MEILLFKIEISLFQIEISGFKYWDICISKIEIGILIEFKIEEIDWDKSCFRQKQELTFQKQWLWISGQQLQNTEWECQNWGENYA